MKNGDVRCGGGGLHFRVAGQRAESQGGVVFSDVGEARNEIEVHEMNGARQAELHQGDEALASGQEFGLFAQLPQQGYAFGYRAGSVIVKWTWVHSRCLRKLSAQGVPRIRARLPIGWYRLKDHWRSLNEFTA